MYNPDLYLAAWLNIHGWLSLPNDVMSEELFNANSLAQANNLDLLITTPEYQQAVFDVELIGLPTHLHLP